MKQGRWVILLLAAVWFGWTGSVISGESPATAEQVQFFESRIRPLLVNRCLACHGPSKQKSDLRLDSPEALRKGGASGEALVTPGQPEKSLLIRAIHHGDEAPRMPPREKLKPQEIADLTRWVKMGAFFPRAASAREGTAEEGRSHWAFQPPTDPPVPLVKDSRWARTPLDCFILSQLEARGLRPAPAADRRTLLRRATFDLIGLPPTPEEMDAFLADPSPNAFARVVERLLASPHYGERWGRHWLDVARYADSNGLDENVAHGNAWRYRDYVVAAFNQDKPYDRFVLEQIAGDLLPQPEGKPAGARFEPIIATGFLALGPKVLAEPDEQKMEMDIIDEQIDALGRAFLGLTLGCARCHDHKFDPLTMEDYYGLAGIFKSTRTMESFKKVARWHENILAGDEDVAKKTAHDQRIARQKTAIQAVITRANEQLKAAKPGTVLPKNAESLYPEATRTELKRLRDELAQMEKTAPALPAAMGVTEGTITNAAVLLRGNHLTPGKVVPRRFPAVLAGADALDTAHSGRLELARFLVRKDQPLTSRVMVNRIWRWHFGQGLVRSTDNFGKLGERPSNPHLLDWLAHRFVESGWSLKAMHRLILLSSTYQMSSTLDDRAARVDPDNRLNWRMNVRRLEAEAIRDAILAVCGRLDRTMGGSLLHVKNREYLFDHTSRDQTQYGSLRRSLYLPVIRNNLYDVFGLFDATDATVGNGDRATTTVATQALFLMNSDLVLQAAEHLAGELLAKQDLADEGRVRLLYQRAYGRPPTVQESARARQALADFDQTLQAREADAGKRGLRAWALLCQVILAANEFVYVN